MAYLKLPVKADAKDDWWLNGKLGKKVDGTLWMNICAIKDFTKSEKFALIFFVCFYGKCNAVFGIFHSLFKNAVMILRKYWDRRTVILEVFFFFPLSVRSSFHLKKSKRRLT